MVKTFAAIQAMDLRLLLWCGRSRHYPGLVLLAQAVSKSGDGYLHVILAFALAWYFPQDAGQILLLFGTAFAIERTMYLVLKNTLKRKRPPEALPSFQSIIKASDEFSFPSGHTMAAFLVASLGTIVVGPAASVLFLWSIAVGASRVVLGVHFPSDILAGSVLGSLVAVVTGFLLPII